MPSIRDKVRGTFLGLAIGDALGMPVETFPHEKIVETYGRITKFHAPDKHKWFDGEPAGMITDDTQLSLAVAEGLIEGGLDMDAQVLHHKLALAFGTKGWGRSTKESVRRLANGASWQKSGEPGGAGNGVAMKVAPVGLYFSTVVQDDEKVEEFCQFVVNLTKMTHPTRIAVASAMAQVTAVYACFAQQPESFDTERFIKLVVDSSKISLTVEAQDSEDDLLERLAEVLPKHSEYDTERAIQDLGKGSCYCYNSIPFSLVHFLNNPQSIDCLYDVITAGGDTDSNGSIVGALLGALHGEEIFPEHLLDFPDRDRVLKIADAFYDLLSAQ
jgi:ADP-ribosylglycohydrolase